MDKTYRFYIAVFCEDRRKRIQGIGTSPDGAVQNVAEDNSWRAPTVFQNDDGSWHVATTTYDDADFQDETEARGYAAQKGCIALPCTERLYRYVQKHGTGVFGRRSRRNAAGLEDLIVDEKELALALHKVAEGLDRSNSRAGDRWKVETAFEDARRLVDSFVWHDQNVAIKAVNNNNTKFRVALDIAVRDLLLESIAERDRFCRFEMPYDGLYARRNEHGTSWVYNAGTDVFAFMISGSDEELRRACDIYLKGFDHGQQRGRLERTAEIRRALEL